MNLDKKIKILIIDDEELICWSLKKIFEKEEYSVNCAHTGDDALRKLNENRYDIVITDLKLPDVRGLEIVKKIKEMAVDTVVIVMSSYFPEPVVDDVMKHGVFRCVNKPFEINDIISDVKDAMEIKEKGAIG
ncbi:MAG TPA: response regulator [Nitrospirae bacterium]|nr:sporulation initiation phosphotransferase F [bacterium BMS3Abin06]HDH12844.1 response regulator [Nitrospirota bacterium]HDZ01621.1 response regulator [Nitrospirota bacterium]